MKLARVLPLVVLPLVAHAEVLDKEFSFSTIAACTIVGTLAAFLAARHKPWVLLLVLPPILLFFAAHLSELLDPPIGRALLIEAGVVYVALSWAGPVLLAAACILGFSARAYAKRDA
jgi:hypothetical protein